MGPSKASQGPHIGTVLAMSGSRLLLDQQASSLPCSLLDKAPQTLL